MAALAWLAMGRRTKIALGGAVVVVLLVQLVFRSWELSFATLLAMGAAGALALLVRLDGSVRRLHRDQAVVARDARRAHRSAAAAQRTAESGLQETRSRADAHGRQHATIDHRVVTLHDQAAARDAARASVLSATQASIGELQSQVTELSEAVAGLTASVHQLQPTARPAPRPAPAPPAATAAVPGQDVVLGLSPTCSEPSVNLVLATFSPANVFAGVRTALLVGIEAMRETGRPLRLVVIAEGDGDPAAVRQELAEWVTRESGDPSLGGRVSVTNASHADRPGYHPDDLWIATYWTTAVTLQRAVQARMLTPDQVLYLVQDWEPGFMAWGTNYALARQSYDAGFRLLVNSTPLASYLTQQTGRPVPADRVFAPQIEATEMHRAAARWEPGSPDHPRLLCYLRPSKPRNLASMALEALSLWGAALPADLRPVVTLAGEDVPPVDLGPRLEVVVAGKTTLDEYYDLVSRTDLGLALMFSPHPSHLPLELPMAGVPTVTNALDGIRRPWVPGLTVAPASPRALADALLEVLPDATALQSHTPQALPSELGGDLRSAVRAALAGQA